MKKTLLALFLILTFAPTSSLAGTLREDCSNSVTLTASFTDTQPHPAHNTSTDQDVAPRLPRPEAALLRSNATALHLVNTARPHVALRALLCEACFFPFSIQRHHTVHKTSDRNTRSPVTIIHFPRPPPHA